MFLNRPSVFTIHCIVTLLIVIACAVDAAAYVTVRPSITLSEQYDSQAGNVISSAQQAKGDFETSITPQIEVVKEEKEWQLKGLYRVSTRFYSRDSSLNYVEQNLNAGVGMNKALSERTSLTLEDSLNYRKNTIDASELGVQTRRTDSLSNSINLDMQHQATKKVSLALSLSDRTTRYEDQAFFDNRTDTASLSATYQWTPQLSGTVGYGYSLYTFDESANESDLSSHSATVSVGYVNPLSTTLALNLSAGLSHVSAIDESVSVTGRANIQKRLRRATLTLDYSRGVSGASSLSRDININESLAASWRYNVSRTFNAGVSGSISRNWSEPSGAADVTTYSGGVNCDWQPYAWMNVGFGYSHQSQKSDTALVDDISRDLVYLNITASYNHWRFK